MGLPRPCLGGVDRRPCAELVHGTRCDQHRAELRRIRNADRDIAAGVVRQWVLEHGAWCPGWGRDAHESIDLTADHVIPLAQGGTNDGPRMVLCRSCNARKGAR